MFADFFVTVKVCDATMIPHGNAARLQKILLRFKCRMKFNKNPIFAGNTKVTEQEINHTFLNHTSDIYEISY